MPDPLRTTVVRQWLVLSLLPPPPEKIDTSALRAKLGARGILVEMRTLQRDLVVLSGVFPIFADDGKKPYGWRWRDGVEFLKFPLPGPATESQLEVRLRGEDKVLRVLFARLRVRDPRIAEDAVILRLDDNNATRRMLLGYADDVEILEPAELRREIVKRAKRIVSLQKK